MLFRDAAGEKRITREFHETPPTMKPINTLVSLV
jgi:hypothetical protein